MTQVDPQIIEKYQKIMASDPSSKVFAPLAEAYRSMGMKKEAMEVCQDGVKSHPDFAGGRIALARLLLDEGEIEKALTELRRATQLAPENVLAHSLLGETHLRMKKPKEALRSFKTLLFLAPDNKKAQNAVAKLESLTADEYEEDVFDMKPLTQAVAEWDEVHLDNENDSDQSESLKKEKLLQRLISVADAHTVRHNHESALEALNEGERLFGPHPEIVKRLKILHQKGLDALVVPNTAADLKPLASRTERTQSRKLHTLEYLLKKFRDLQTKNP